MHVQGCHHLVSLLVVEQSLLGMVSAVAEKLTTLEEGVRWLVFVITVSLSIEKLIVVSGQESR